MDILVKPIITEKMTAQAEKLNRYGDRERVKKRTQARKLKKSVILQNTF